MSLIKCVECGETISDSAKVCPHCGMPVIKCHECGEPLPQKALSCPHCGAPADMILEEKVQTPPKSFNKTKTTIILTTIIIFLLFLIFTCPSKDRHMQVLEDEVTAAMTDMRDSMEISSNWMGFVKMITDQVTKVIINNQFEVDNYWVCSVGKLHLNEQESVVSFGICHHVFCFLTKEKIKEAISKWQNDKKNDVKSVISTIKGLFDFGGGEDESSGSSGNIIDEFINGQEPDNGNDTPSQETEDEKDLDSPISL